MISEKKEDKNEEFSLHLRYLFRKSIPSMNLLYLFIIILKFIPGLLISNDISFKESSNTTISSILSKITISPSSLNKINFQILFIFIYLFIIILIILIFYLKLKVKYLSRQFSTLLSASETDGISFQKDFIFLINFLIILYLIIVLFSQHIDEILFYGFFNFFTKNKSESAFNSDYYKTYNKFLSSISINRYIILILNLISVLALDALIYFFFELFTFKNMAESFGFSWKFNKFSTILIIILSNFQGFESFSYFLEGSKAEQFKLILCVITFVLTFLFFINVIRDKIILDIFELVIVSLSNICLCSSILELLLRGIYTEATLSQKYSIIKLIVVIIDGIVLSLLVNEINKRKILNQISLKGFNLEINEKNEIFKNVYLVKYFIEILLSDFSNKKNLSKLSYILQKHQEICSNQNCLCNQYESFNYGSYKENMFEFMKYLCDKIIKYCIMASEVNIVKKRSFLEELYILQITFELALNKNYNKALYLGQTDLKKRIKFSFKGMYSIFEIRKLVEKKFYEKHVERKPTEEEGSVSSNEQLLQVKAIVSEEIFANKIKHICYQICLELSKIIAFRQLFITKNSIHFNSDSILKILLEYIKHLKQLNIFSSLYFRENRRHTLEIKYILSKFIRVNLNEKEVLGKYLGFDPVSNFDKLLLPKIIHEENVSYLMNELYENNVIKIKYISMKLLRILNYDRQEIINMDLSDLIPSSIGPIHNEFVKTYMINCHMDSSFQRNTFLCNKRQDLLSISTKSRVFPSLENPLLLVSEITILDQNKDSKHSDIFYYAFLDETFNFNSLSPEFKRDFNIQLSTLQKFNVTFPQLFGINIETLTRYFGNRYSQKSVKQFNTQISSINVIEKESHNNKDYSNNTQTFIQENSGLIKTKYENISKTRMLSSLKYIISHLDESGKEQGTENEFEILQSKIHSMVKVNLGYKREATKATHNLNNNLVNIKQGKGEDNSLFIIKIDKKYFKNCVYYLCGIRAKVNFRTSWAELNDLLYDEVNHPSINPSRIDMNDHLSTIKNSCQGSFIMENDENNNINNSIINGSFKKGQNSNLLSVPKTSLFDKKTLKNSFDDPSPTHSKCKYNASHAGTVNKRIMNNQETTETGNTGKELNVSTSQNNSYMQNSKINFLKQSYSIRKRNDFLSNNLKGGLKQAQFPSSMAKLTAINIKYAHLKKNTFYLRLLQVFFYLILFVLLILVFILNKNSLDKIKDLFLLNSYCFMLSFDIFSCSLNSIRGCFIYALNDTDSLEQHLIRKDSIEQDIITDSHKFTNQINKMVINEDALELYYEVNSNKDYMYLTNDWSMRNANTSLISEIDYFIYSFSVFDLQKSQCRIKEMYFPEDNITATILQETTKPTKEEKVIFYIINNVITIVTNTLDRMTNISTKLLSSYQNSFKITSILLILFIIIVAFVIYLDVIITINYNRSIFKEYLQNLLEKKDDEQLTINIKKLLELLNNFSYNSCINYEKEHRELARNNNSQLNISPINSNSYCESPNLKTNKSLLAKKGQKVSQLFKDKKDLKAADKGASKSNEDNSNEEGNDNANKKKIIDEPFISKITIVGIIILFIIFTTIQVINLVFNFQFNSNLSIENKIAISYFTRIPRMTELVLYSIISCMEKQSDYIKAEPSEYNDEVFNELFNPNINYKKMSLYDKLKDTRYFLLYYKILIYEECIEDFYTDKSKRKLFKSLSDLISISRETEDFCAIIGKYYSYYFESDINDKSDLSNFSKLKEKFEYISSMSKNCYNLGRGINSSGNKRAIDLHLLHLNEMFMGLASSNMTLQNQKDFYTNEDLIYFMENLQDTLRALHKISDIFIVDDIQSNLDDKYSKDVIFAIISIIFSLGLIFVIIYVVIGKIEKYTDILKESTTNFNNSIDLYNKEKLSHFLKKAEGN